MFLSICLESHLLLNCCMWERVKQERSQNQMPIYRNWINRLHTSRNSVRRSDLTDRFLKGLTKILSCQPKMSDTTDTFAKQHWKFHSSFLIFWTLRQSIKFKIKIPPVKLGSSPFAILSYNHFANLWRTFLTQD